MRIFLRIDVDNNHKGDPLKKMGSLVARKGDIMGKNNKYVPSFKQEIKQGILLPRCHMCSQVPIKGIKGGIWIKKSFICSKCEQEVIHTEVGESRYQFILEKIKQIIK